MSDTPRDPLFTLREAAAAPLPDVPNRLTCVTRIYMGRRVGDRPDVVVPDAMVRAFVETTVAKAFPDGFTLIGAAGGWRDTATGATILEPSFVIEVMHDGSERAAERVLAVANGWKRLARQQAVMIAEQRADVSFV